MYLQMCNDCDGVLWRIKGYRFLSGNIRLSLVKLVIGLHFIARDSIYAKRAYAIAIPSVCLPVCPSIRHTGGSVKNGWS